MDSVVPKLSWPPPPPEFDLGESDIHVWSASLDSLAGSATRLVSILSASERERAERHRFERHRQWFIARRGLLRILLGRYLDNAPSELAFAYTARGKPSVTQHPGARVLHFNLSDSAGLALVAVTRSAPLGVDVERIEPVRDMDGVAARFFSAREKATIDSLPEFRKAEAFFNCWTRKEAYLKATGEGISDSLPAVEVTLAPGDPPRLLGIAGDTQPAAQWTFSSVDPAPGFVGALAIRARGLKLSCWQWPVT